MTAAPPRLLSSPLWLVVCVVVASAVTVLSLAAEGDGRGSGHAGGFPGWTLDSGVLITAEGCPAESFGVGAVVDGGIVTNAHVVAGADRVMIHWSQDSRAVDASVVAFDPLADLALLQPALPVGKPLSVAEPEGGTDAYAIARVIGTDGRPELAAIDVHIKRRIRILISDIYGDGDYERAGLELVADIGPGDSGAGIVNTEGELVGVIFSASRGQTDIAYGISALELADLLDAAGPEPVTTGLCR